VSAASHPEQPRRVLLVAAVLTVVAAVAFDLIAGEAPLHAATLGVIAASVSLLRMRLTDRRHHPLQFVSACVVVQPALHVVANILPHHPLEHGTGRNVGPADLLVIGTQVTVVLAIAGALSFTEQIISLLAGTVRICGLLITLGVSDAEPDRRRYCIAPARQLPAGRYRSGSILRRGPPSLVLAA
jgi:hypothetical protein